MLTDLESWILETSGKPLPPGAIDDQARQRGLSPTRYYQILNRLLERQDALEHSPILVNRLRRRRGERMNPRGYSRAV